jgi:phosphohistidine phosphatase
MPPDRKSDRSSSSPARVFLVRHAKAEPRHDGDDPDRRLTPEGRARFERHVKALERKLRITRVLTSPYARARETAEILAAATGAPLEEDERLASGASSGKELIALAREAASGTALVGHNPEVAEAIARAAGKELQVKTGAVAALDVDGKNVELVWFEVPGKG